MILIWGLPNDPSTEAVCDWLTLWRAPVFFLNHAEIHRTQVSLTSGSELAFHVTCGRRSCRLNEVTAAYLRPYNYRDYPAPPDDLLSDSGPAMVHHLISAWAEYSPALIVSRPSSEGTNQSKLYQAVEIRSAGFLTPESMVSNRRTDILAFLERHGRLIYKSMSNVRSIVKELSAGELDGKVLGPTLFQQRIEGQNVRVHVVGEQCFASAIETAGTDYRYASSQMSPIELPSDVADRAVLLTQRLGLTLAGVDLILTAKGDWYCLEVNPNPAFMSFPHGEQVARAVARQFANTVKSKQMAAEKVRLPFAELPYSLAAVV